MKALVITLVYLTLAVPAAVVLIAARQWRARLARPGLFVLAGLLMLYLLVAWIMTRTIPTHATAVSASHADAQALMSAGLGALWPYALAMLAGVTAASLAVVFALRRGLSR